MIWRDAQPLGTRDEISGRIGGFYLQPVDFKDIRLDMLVYDKDLNTEYAYRTEEVPNGSYIICHNGQQVGFPVEVDNNYVTYTVSLCQVHYMDQDTELELKYELCDQKITEHPLSPQLRWGLNGCSG